MENRINFLLEKSKGYFRKQNSSTKKLLFFALIYFCSTSLLYSQEKYQQSPGVSFVSESIGLTNVPFFYYSKYTKEWKEKTGGFYHSDDENFEELKLIKYVTNNTPYYCFTYTSSVPYELDISTQLLQIENGTYRGSGAISEIKHSFYITNKQYQNLKSLLNGNENKSILLKSKLCDSNLDRLLYKKQGQRLKRMKIEKLGNKVRFLLPQSLNHSLVINFKKRYYEVNVQEFKDKILID